MSYNTLLFFLLSCLLCHCISYAWEWAGVFSVHTEDEGTHSLLAIKPQAEEVEEHNDRVFWSFEKSLSSEAYAENTIRIYITTVEEASSSALQAKGEEVEEIFANNDTTVILPFWNQTAMNHMDIPVNQLVTLSLNEDSWLTLYSIYLPHVSGHYMAVFAEHDPHEFTLQGVHNEEEEEEENTYFLRDIHGHVFRPLVEIEGEHTYDLEEAHSDKDWGQIMGGVIVVWLVTFIGLIFVVVPLHIQQSKSIDWYLNYWGKKFAAGALLGTAFNLILLESSALIGSYNNGNIEESKVSGYWGAMILCGFVTSFIVELVFDAVIFQVKSNEPTAILPVATQQHNCEKESFPVVAAHSTEANVSKLEEGHEGQIVPADDNVLGKTDEVSKKEVVSNTSNSCMDYLTPDRVRIISAILVGDFFHNFCDGIFIGAAFISCGNSFGWTVATVSIFHEIIQELADFLVLTKVATLPSHWAIFWNAVSGLSVILGGISIAAASHISDFSVGMLLAFGAGQYIFVATVELLGSDSHVHHASSIADSSVADPEVHQQHHKKPSYFDRMVGLFCFCLAAVAVGLVLLNHTHCENEESASGGHQH